MHPQLKRSQTPEDLKQSTFLNNNPVKREFTDLRQPTHSNCDIFAVNHHENWHTKQRQNRICESSDLNELVRA